MSVDTFHFPSTTQSWFIQGKQQVSGQQWAQECLSLAACLGDYKQQNWLLYDDDFYRYSRYFFALLLANKNIVLAQSNQPERIQEASHLAEISIGDFATHAVAKASGLTHFQLPELATAPLEAASLEATAINANITITLFTSGSTGSAKAIKKYWYQLANEVACLATMFPQQQGCVLSTVTHKHIYGLLFKLLWPVFTHKKIICETIEYPEQVEAYCQTLDNLLLISSPSYLERTSKQLSPQASQKITQLFSSGGALSATVAEQFCRLNQQRITEIYGSTETGGIAWRQQVTQPQWQLFPNHQASLAADNTLQLSSAFLPKGEIYKTDDRVELNGRFFNLLGRVDRIIKLHEKRLSLDEMETLLKQVTPINACYCFMLANEQNKPRLVAVLAVTERQFLPANGIQKKHLVDRCKQLLSTSFEPSLLPRKWRFVQQLPFNTQGKLVKSALIELFK